MGLAETMGDSIESDVVLKGFDDFASSLGDELRGERATLGKSLLDVQRDLRIKAAYISAIENCDPSVFPNQGFVAGYVRSYARYLKIDPEDLDDLVFNDIMGRCRRSPEVCPKNPYYARVNTAADVVQFVNAQPRLECAA